MKTRIEEEKELTGSRIDVNWLKYKIHKDPKYLRKLNELINKMVIIDIEIERRKKLVNVQHVTTFEKNSEKYRTSEKGTQKIAEKNNWSNKISEQVEEKARVFLGRYPILGVVPSTRSAEGGRGATPSAYGIEPYIPSVPLFGSHGPGQQK